jgi:hypothetical protein
VSDAQAENDHLLTSGQEMVAIHRVEAGVLAIF